MCDCCCYQLGKDIQQILDRLGALEQGGVGTGTGPGPGNGGNGGQTPPPDPQLVGAGVRFNTTDNDKDGDTLVDVTVTNQSGTVIADKTGISGHYNNNSSTSVALDLRNPVTKSQVSAGTVTVTIHPNGNDHWDFNYELDLTYADGTSTTHNWSGLVLTQDSQTTQNQWSGH